MHPTLVRLLGLPIAAACAAAVCAACGDPEDSISVGKGKDRSLPGELDAAIEGGSTSDAAVDASLPFDASDMDAWPPGATMDAAVLGLDASLMLPSGTLILSDGGILLPDGQVIDADEAVKRYETEPDLMSCELMEGNAWEGEVDVVDEGGFALVPGPTGFGLAYRSRPVNGTCPNIEVMHIPASTGFPEPSAVLADCKQITDVSLSKAGSSWQLAWVDNFTNVGELQTAALDGEMRLPDGTGRRTLTSNGTVTELRPVVKEVGDRPFVIWVERNRNPETDVETNRIVGQWIDGDGGPIEIVGDTEGHAPQRLALSQVGEENAAVAWVGPEDNPGVWLQPIASDGTRAGLPVKLTDRVAAGSSIDLAQREDGGAAVYSIEIDGRPQVRFRRLDRSGTPIGEERILIGTPLRAQDASVFALAGGYAVVYRALPGGSVTETEVRMTFVSKDGSVMRDPTGALQSFLIAPATVATSRLYVVVSVEGQIMVGWIDADTESNALKLVRQRLDCR